MHDRYSHRQVFARDERGERHVVRVTRAPVPGSHGRLGPPRFTWHDGRSLRMVDPERGVLECSETHERLTIEDWSP
jgi:hypothetical protein